MKVSLGWIRGLTQVNLTNDELIVKIGAQLGAVEDVEDWGSYFDDAIVVARIAEASDHPDAEKLGLYTIDVGSDHTRQLVAGDKTLKVDDLVGYIPPGARVPVSVRSGDPFTIEARKLRGVESQGMLGSGKELLINEDHEAVAVLGIDAKPGDSFKSSFQLDDVIIDIENKMFTHRPDLFGLIGVAREVAGIQNLQFSGPDFWSTAIKDFELGETELELEIENTIPELVNRFSAAALSGVEIKPSPMMAQSYLMRLGMRPINNIVDITNYLAHLTAQPLHAFDYDKLCKLDGENSAKIVIRNAKAGESIEVLDGRIIQLSEDTVVIASRKVPISIGGMIGGRNSEVDHGTTRVIFEVGNFNMYSIRRSSFRHGIFTDAVTRFNKGQSPDQTTAVLQKAVADAAMFAGAHPASQIADSYPVKRTVSPVVVSAQFINDRLGIEFTADDIVSILSNVELSSSSDGDNVTVQPPFWRQDIAIAEDIVEEVGRLHGYDHLPVSLPNRSTAPSSSSDEWKRNSAIRGAAISVGYNEVINYSFCSEKLMSSCGFDVGNAFRIKNSLAPALELYRMAVLPSLLGAVRPNLKNGFTTVRMFEVGKVHNKTNLISDEHALPAEMSRMAAVYASADDTLGFYEVKRLLVDVLSERGVSMDSVTCTPIVDFPKQLGELDDMRVMFEPKRTAVVRLGDEVIGLVGQIDNSVTSTFKLPSQSAGFEIVLSQLDKAGSQKEFKAISSYPGMSQDITLEVESGISFEDVEKLLNSVEVQVEGLQVSSRLIDIFRKEEAGDTRFTVSLDYQHPERTLTRAEAATQTSAIAAEMADKIAAKLI